MPSYCRCHGVAGSDLQGDCDCHPNLVHTPTMEEVENFFHDEPCRICRVLNGENTPEGSLCATEAGEQAELVRVPAITP